MAEGLREVAEQLAGSGVDLLGQQADVVDEAGGPLEDRPGPFGPAGQGQRLGQPEGAQQEGALLAGEAVDALGR